MKANRRADTTPELRLRSLLHRRGYRFRKDARISLPDGSLRADIVFARARLAVFVDGCFWHSCPLHGETPRANAEYWVPKLAENAARDRRTDARLQDAGWTVHRIWEHVPPEQAVEEIVALLADA